MKFLEVIYFEDKDTKLNAVLPEVVNGIINNKEDLRGKVKLETVNVEGFKPSGSVCLYVTTFETFKWIDMDIVDLFGKVIFFITPNSPRKSLSRRRCFQLLGYSTRTGFMAIEWNILRLRVLSRF